MRSPTSPFDFRGALTDEVRAAAEELDHPATPRGVHRCRVRLKRARALARVGHIHAPGLASVFNDSARGVMRTLARARDLQALADTARRLAEKLSGKAASGLRSAAQTLDAARAALAPIDDTEVRAGLRDLLALAHVWPEAPSRQIAKGAERIARRARTAWQDGRRADHPERRHTWRQREKDRLYVVELLGGCWSGKRRRKRSAALVEVLGRERDVFLLLTHLEAEPSMAGGVRPAEAAIAALKQRHEKLARKADRLAAKVHAGGA